MRWMKWMVAPLAWAGCVVADPVDPADTDDPTTDPVDPTEMPAPVTVRTIVLTAGPNWDIALPPEQQDLGDHIAWATESFDAGELLAYGPFLDDGRGFYVYLDETAPATDSILDADPALASGVLALDQSGSWDLFFEALGTETSDALFVLEARPGTAWEDGIPLLGQDLDAHLGNMTDLFVGGTLLAGGPVSEDEGRYVITAADQAAAEAVAATDPGVTSGVLSMIVRPWGPFARQSVASAQAR